MKLGVGFFFNSVIQMYSVMKQQTISEIANTLINNYRIAATYPLPLAVLPVLSGLIIRLPKKFRFSVFPPFYKSKMKFQSQSALEYCIINLQFRMNDCNHKCLLMENI